MARDKTNEIDTSPAATSATTATTSILTAPDSFGDAKEFALVWLKAIQDSEATGWNFEFRVAFDGEGRFVSATITREFVGFDLKQRVEEALEALQYDKPLDESKSHTLLNVLWEKQHELKSEVGRPTGSPWAGTIWQIAHCFKCSGFPLSRNLESPETSGFDAIAKAMLELGLAPNSYSGVKNNYYGFAERNDLS